MQIKTEILIENIILAVAAIAVFYIALQFTTEDNETDTDFPTKDQFQKCDKSNKQCAMLGEIREC